MWNVQEKKNWKYILESDANIITWNCALDKAWLKSAMAMSASEVIVIRLVRFSGLDRAHLFSLLIILNVHDGVISLLSPESHYVFPLVPKFGNPYEVNKQQKP